MCGIGAIINGDIQNLSTLMVPIRKRGDANSFNEHKKVSKNVVLACNRLRIVDRDNATQPMHNEDETIFVVFNGEIYNYQSLKQELQNKGHIFKTDSDTEVLCHGYEEWNAELPKKLDGKFAFVIYDKKQNNYFSARDRFGIKPLYFAKKKKTIFFASEIKQLIRLVNKIREVPPGHYVQNEKCISYYSVPNTIIQDSVEQIKNNIRNLLDESVKKRLQTDLPVAVFLSGGIDSTSVLATALKYHTNITAITMGREFDGVQSDRWYAKKFCQENNIPLIEAEPPTEDELVLEIPGVIWQVESFEPNLVKQTPLSMRLARIAHKHGFKIVLCGEGADELFAGYPEFCNNQRLLKDFFSDLYRSQLKRIDRSGMANQVEIRVPFLDTSFVEYCINIPIELKLKEGTQKWIFRQAMSDRVPDYIRERKKVVLSEGMGLKGNSLKNGLFSEKFNELQYQEKFFGNDDSLPNSIRSVEERYYYDLYRKYQFDKLNDRNRIRANSVNSVNEETVVQQIISVLQSKNFSRDKPFELSELYKRINAAIQNNLPLKLVGFWGVSNKTITSTADQATISHLLSLQQEIKKVYSPGVDLLFIIAHEHGKINGFNESAIYSYGAAIKNRLEHVGFRTRRLQDLWNKHGLNFETINQHIYTNGEKIWGEIINKEIILKNAGNINQENPLRFAVRYVVMRILEKKMLEHEFKDGIFHTFSDSKMRELLPNMPTLYLFARKGWSDAPWFIKD